MLAETASGYECSRFQRYTSVVIMATKSTAANR